ncbi:hypothetical protein EVAR_97588_1 [Eumeta japonica]|uniref:Uncharacterized protein n=1 Tax=Eumeta variegata TaxID=151549 RepID=A0A4C1XHZ8_EUMVA|nr:hypothetical protein EVAR_97588_1 [Eumeta japonica]
MFSQRIEQFVVSPAVSRLIPKRSIPGRYWLRRSLSRLLAFHGHCVNAFRHYIDRSLNFRVDYDMPVSRPCRGACSRANVRIFTSAGAASALAVFVAVDINRKHYSKIPSSSKFINFSCGYARREGFDELLLFDFLLDVKRDSRFIHFERRCGRLLFRQFVGFDGLDDSQPTRRGRPRACGGNFLRSQQIGVL